MEPSKKNDADVTDINRIYRIITNDETRKTFVRFTIILFVILKQLPSGLFYMLGSN